MTGTTTSPPDGGWGAAGRLAAVLGVPALVSALSLGGPVLAGFTSLSCLSAPVGGVSAPVGGHSAPVGGHSAPVGGHSAPVGGHSAPVGGHSAPVGGHSAPVGGHSAPVGGHSAPVGCQSAPVPTTAPPVFLPAPPAAPVLDAVRPAASAEPSVDATPSVSATTGAAVSETTPPARPAPRTPAEVAEAAAAVAVQTLPSTVSAAERAQVERSVQAVLPTVVVRASSSEDAAAAVQNAVAGSALLLGRGLSAAGQSGAVATFVQGAAALAVLPAAQQTALRSALAEAVRASAAAGHLSSANGHEGGSAVLTRVVDALLASGLAAHVDADLVGRVLTTAAAAGATGDAAGGAGTVSAVPSIGAGGAWTLQLRGLRVGEKALVVLSVPGSGASRSVLETGAGRSAAAPAKVLSYDAVADGSGQAVVRAPADVLNTVDPAARRAFFAVVARGTDGVRRVFARPARPALRPAAVRPVPPTFAPGASLVISGTAAAGEDVQLLASEAGLRYRLLREVRTGPSGTYSFTTKPVWSTRFVVRVVRGADEKADARSFAVLATPRLTASSSVSGRTVVLRGAVLPARAGAPVLVAGSVSGTGRTVVLGRAVTDRAGRWTLRRTFGAPAAADVTARVAADRFHVAGRSQVVRVRVR